MTEHAEPVSVSRTIAAPAATIFAVLADPARQQDMDGSGMLRGTASPPITRVGEVFVMNMHYEPLGDYEMNNHVVAFEPGRRIAWQPVSGRGHPDAGAANARWGHTWSFELHPDGPSTTTVTETWDCLGAVEDEDGTHWIPSMTATLARLEQLCTQAAEGMSDQEAIQDVVARFFAAFVSGPDSGGRLAELRRLMLPQAVIIRTCGGEPTVYDVDSFIAPRQQLLESGNLLGFREWEVQGRTEVFGDIAQHFCSYAKTGVQQGAPFSARGMKALQLVRTVVGWRISAVAWDDERDGLTLGQAWVPSEATPLH
jgi:uncharacterized protein YndB with AHSA1/START domain